MDGRIDNAKNIINKEYAPGKCLESEVFDAGYFEQFVKQVIEM